MVSQRDHHYGQIALQNNFLTKEQLETCLRLKKGIQDKHGREYKLEDLLIEKGFISDSQNQAVNRVLKRLKDRETENIRREGSGTNRAAAVSGSGERITSRRSRTRSVGRPGTEQRTSTTSKIVRRRETKSIPAKRRHWVLPAIAGGVLLICLIGLVIVLLAKGGVEGGAGSPEEQRSRIAAEISGHLEAGARAEGQGDHATAWEEYRSAERKAQKSLAKRGSDPDLSQKQRQAEKARKNAGQAGLESLTGQMTEVRSLMEEENWSEARRVTTAAAKEAEGWIERLEREGMEEKAFRSLSKEAKFLMAEIEFGED